MKHTEWTKNATIYEVNLRQYTPSGTFREFEQHLPAIQKMGVRILWFMPIQPIGEKNRKGSLGSYYSISNYTAVNQEFGTLEEFKNLVKKIHEMGMYVLLDWVANHTAWDHVWTKNQPDFFEKDAHGNFKSPVAEWQDVIKLDYSNQAMQKQMIKDMVFWLQEADIDGFRCDMAHLVPTSFWNEARAEICRQKPVFMLAESENRDLLELAFDMIYNWNIHHISNRIARGENCVWDIDNSLQHELFDFPRHAYQMFFTDNHDENSWHGSAIERYGAGLETFNVLMFTLPGMPLIYSGQEAGMDKKLAFFDKDLIRWQADKMRLFYTRLVKLKTQNEALWNGLWGGSLERICTKHGMEIFAFVRRKNGHEVLVILNLSERKIKFTLQNDFQADYHDIFTEKTVQISKNQQLNFNSWEYLVLERR